MKKNLLSKFKKSAVTIVVKGISEFENEKIMNKVLGNKVNKVDNKNYQNGNSSCDLELSTFSIERILKKGDKSVCFIK